MTDHITRVREQAEREAWELFPDEGSDPVSGEKIDDYGYAQTERDGYVRGQVDLASRLTREKIAKTLFAHSISNECGSNAPEIYSQCESAADAILAPLVEGEVNG